ncbi:hypothetical protein [Staphylococcus warneri]|uniref:hypothetical protein n=1 Tax=Staphylococcus warneri TaxID=1292 RepID=UPI0039F619AA
MASRMTPKMTAMKDSVLNQSKNFTQNHRVGQMLRNMRGQASHTVQQGKQWIGHQAQQVKQATNNILEKEIPFTQPRVAIAGAGSVQIGKGVTLREAGQHIQRSFTPNHQVTHTPKDSMVKSEGKHVRDRENKIQYNGQNKGKVQKMSKRTLKKLRRTTPSVEIRKEINKDLKNKLGQPDPAIPGKFITSTLEADHIVPFKEITKMDNIEKLSFDEIKDILNYRKNFIGLSKIANSSKGSKSYQEWRVYRKENLSINKEFREKMIRKENLLYNEIQQKINRLSKGR